MNLLILVIKIVKISKKIEIYIDNHIKNIKLIYN